MGNSVGGSGKGILEYNVVLGNSVVYTHTEFLELLRSKFPSYGITIDKIYLPTECYAYYHLEKVINLCKEFGYKVKVIQYKMEC